MGKSIKELEQELLEACNYIQREINDNSGNAECRGIFVRYNPKDPKEFDIVIRIREKECTT